MLGIVYSSKEPTSIGFSSEHKGFNWFLFILALACGIGAYYATYKYLVLALDMAEPNSLAREAAKVLAIVTISATALLFIIKPFIKNAWLKWLTILIIAYEILTMGTNQYVAFKDSASPQINNQAQIENLQQEIKSLESDADSLRKNGKSSGNSKYLISRQEGNALLDKASIKTNLSNQKRNELSILINNNKVTFGTVIPDWVLKIKCALRSFILPGIISFCFYIIGLIFHSLFGAFFEKSPAPLSDGSDPKGKKKDNQKDNEKVDLKKDERVASVNPVSAKYKRTEYDRYAGWDVKNYDKNKVKGVRVDEQKTEHHDLGLVLGKTNIPNTDDSVREKGAETTSRIRRKRSKGSPDTCISKGKNLRYKTLKAKVKKGLQPSIRSLRKAAGGGDYTTLSKYLAAMAQEGIIEKQEDGTYRLIAKRPKLKAV